MSDFGHAETGDKARRDACVARSWMQARSRGSHSASPHSQYSAAVAGGMRGALTGAAISGPTIYLLHRNVAGFRGLSLPVKTRECPARRAPCGESTDGHIGGWLSKLGVHIGVHQSGRGSAPVAPSGRGAGGMHMARLRLGVAFELSPVPLLGHLLLAC
jgi:hypothetical protein